MNENITPVSNSNMLTFLNQNSGAVSGVIALLALIVSIVAIFLTVSANRNQMKLALLDERYTVYSRFSQLVEMVNILTCKGLTPKGKIWIWNMTFFGIKGVSSQLGAEIVKYDEQLSVLDESLPEYLEILHLKEKSAAEKFSLDFSTYTEDLKLLSKSRLLFSDEISTYIAKFLGIYHSAILAVNFEKETRVIEIFNSWESLNNEIRDNKIIDKIDEYIMFLKK